MHIKATGQITLSAALLQWLTTAANGRAESHNACWLEIQYGYTNSTNPGTVVRLS